MNNLTKSKISFGQKGRVFWLRNASSEVNFVGTLIILFSLTIKKRGEFSQRCDCVKVLH